MIIGISGKINSGKDTVASMIQGVHDGYSDEDILSTIKEQGGFYKNHVSFEIRRFADTLKDITCMLTGCTREQLEDREFKEKPLGEEWRRWYVKKGNSSNIKYFVTEAEAVQYYYYRYSGANPKEYRDVIKSEILTRRLMMQLLGTEAGREIIHPNVWVNALFADYGITDLSHYKAYPQNYDLPNWIIPDTRFENEAKAIKDRGGILIRVNRSCETCGEYPPTDICSACGNQTHPSETSLDKWEDWDFVIENNSTLEDLLTKVKGIYEQIKT